MNASIWVTRAKPGAEVTAAALRAAGYMVIAAPLVQVAALPQSRIPPGPWPDWLVFVSANAVTGFRHAMQSPDFPTRSAMVRVAAVGEATALAAREAGWQVDLVPQAEHSEGLAAAFATINLKDKRVWVPSGNRAGSATRDLPDALTRHGAAVAVFQVYETRDRRLSKEDLAALHTATPGAWVAHSPSAVAAAHACNDKAVRRWLTEAVVVVMGPTTQRRAQDLGHTRVQVCARPADGALVDALIELPGLRES